MPGVACVQRCGYRMYAGSEMERSDPCLDRYGYMPGRNAVRWETNVVGGGC